MTPPATLDATAPTAAGFIPDAPVQVVPTGKGIGADIVGWLHDGLTRYWRYPCGDGEATVVDLLPADLRARAERALLGTWNDGRSHLSTPLVRPRLSEAFGGVNRDFNARVGLDDEFPMVMGTGY